MKVTVFGRKKKKLSGPDRPRGVLQPSLGWEEGTRGRDRSAFWAPSQEVLDGPPCPDHCGCGAEMGV